MAYKIQDVIASAYGLVSVSAGGPGSGRHKILYHGTTSKAVKGIQKDGLLPNVLNTQDRFSEKGRVYLTTDKHTAVRYAGMRSELLGGRPVVLHVKIPSNVYEKSKKDYGDPFGIIVSKVRPEGIKHVEHIAKDRIAESSAKSLRTITRSVTSAAHKLARKTEFRGLPISIETDKGQIRKGVGKDGRPWKIRMPWPYGYIRLTQGTDKDHIDCFIGPNADAKNVYVIHQNKEDAKKYDEDKVMLGFDSADQALAAYKSAYTGVNLFRSMSVLSVKEFKRKISKTKGLKRPHKIHAGGPGSGRHKDAFDELLQENRELRKRLPSNVTVYHGTDADPKKILSEGLRSQDKQGLFVTVNKADAYGYGAHVFSTEVPKEWLIPYRGSDSGEFKHAMGFVAPKYLRKEEPDISAFVEYNGDSFQYNEKIATQPIVPAHPPSLKNPIKVKVNNPDDEDIMYKSKKMKKRLAKDIAERTRTGAAKPEIVQTTLFVPMSQG